MKNLKKAKFYFGALILCVFFNSCISIEQAYQSAKQKNDIVIYDKFLKKYPKSTYTEEIEKLRIEQAYKIAKQADNVEKYNNFLKKYPNSMYTTEFTNRVDRILLDACKLLDCPAMYEGYIASSPKSIYLEECKQLLQKKINEYKDAVNNNWSKLKIGMSLEDVKKLIPFDCGTEGGGFAMTSQIGNTITKRQGFGPNNFCTLFFINDKLEEWKKN